ncbi:MAG: hypothetical protein GY874_09390 [Desulfobacteraceae bacterium]|nr:hypothetical protein [Desulfobacteraceae bacterium]
MAGNSFAIDFDVANISNSSVGSNYLSQINADGHVVWCGDNGSDWEISLAIPQPQEPVIVASVDTPSAAREISVSGNYAYVADGKSGIHVVKLR